MQSRNVSESPTEKEVRSNGVSEPQQKISGVDATVKDNDQRTDSNEARISCPKNLASDEVLDTVLTAWTILIQRYQRDVFHQLTWGAEAAGDRKDNSQCIPTTELDLSNQLRAGDLKAKLNKVRLSNISLHPGSTVFLNDGTSAEVCISRTSVVDLD